MVRNDVIMGQECDNYRRSVTRVLQDGLYMLRIRKWP
jgi:hypothetical protein